MGQKVSPHGLRVGVIKKWDSMWIANKENTRTFMQEDIKLRNFLTKTLGRAAQVGKITIERNSDKKVIVNIHSARPAVVLGEEGKNIKNLLKGCEKAIARKREIKLNVVAIENADLDPQILADWIAEQLENRASFRTVQKKAMQRAMKAGAKGIKTAVSGRLGGADMARTEGYAEGNVPLHTIRANVSYATAEADTTFGKFGVKVWVCTGEVLGGMI